MRPLAQLSLLSRNFRAVPLRCNPVRVKFFVLRSTTTMAATMVDAADFAELNRQFMEEDELREQLIKRSREVLKLSKNSIYALHRGEVPKAREMVKEAKEIAKRELIPLVEKCPSLRHGAFSGAMEEFAEAVIFAEFLGSSRIPTIAELEIVNREEYFGGIMDFTGELNRYAVLRATARDIEGVLRCRDVCDQLFGQLMLIEWRNGNLRRKFDAVKYTVKKLEQIIYELTLASSTGGAVVPKGSPDEPGAPGGDAPAEGGEAGAGDDAAGGEGGGASSGGGGRGGRGGKRMRA